MQLAEIEQFIERIAPGRIAWERDNAGLQLGDRSQKVKRILLSLDITEQIAKEAIQNNVQLIVTHHPLFFHKPSSLTESTSQGRISRLLIRNNISLLSVHTNLDFAMDGVNHALAGALKLTKIRFLSPIRKLLVKMVFFIPAENAEMVLAELFKQGAGEIGDYSECSFTVDGAGTFRGSDLSHPFIGSKGKRNKIKEHRVEVIAPKQHIDALLRVLKDKHPYEEPAVDIYPLENAESRAGIGVIGVLPRPMSNTAFLSHVRRSLGTQSLRHSAPLRRQISTVALVGGAGAEYMGDAIKAGADAFITADVRYHMFMEAEGSILLVDAGHFETERTILSPLKLRLNQYALAQKQSLTIMISKQNNPVHYF